MENDDLLDLADDLLITFLRGGILYLAGRIDVNEHDDFDDEYLASISMKKPQ